MPKKILSVLPHTEYRNLEDPDIGLFASAFAPVTGNEIAHLLGEDRVNHRGRGQDGTGIKIAGGTVQPGFLIETDIQSVQSSNVPVYAVREDLEERGIDERELVTGVKLMSQRELGKFVDRFDTVWNW